MMVLTTRSENDESMIRSRRQFLTTSSCMLGGLGDLAFESLVSSSMATAAAPMLKARASPAPTLNWQERAALQGLTCKGLRYAIENQFGFGVHAGAHPSVRGLISDRQRNFSPPQEGGMASMSATGMGLIALALACMEEHRLIPKAEAIARIRLAIETALKLPHEAGIGAHFVCFDGSLDCCEDRLSTVDFAWLVIGALVAASLLQSGELMDLANQLYSRINWRHWVDTRDSRGLIRHGRGRQGNWLPASWDLANAETLLLYLLAIGHENDPLPAEVLRQLDAHRVDVNGVPLASGDTPLFTRQWARQFFRIQAGDDVIRLTGVNFPAEEESAVRADRAVCRDQASRFATYKIFCGISSGDGPGGKDPKGGYRTSDYREYKLTGLMDGTAHPTALLCSAGAVPELVFEVVQAAQSQPWKKVGEGRYGLSTINVGHERAKHRVPGTGEKVWAGPDMVAIDVFMAAFAMDNMSTGGRIQEAFMQLPCTKRAIERMRRAV